MTPSRPALAVTSPTGGEPGRGAGADSPGDLGTIDQLATGPVLGIAATVVAVLTVLSTRLGYHRDEFYYLWGGEHLAWGYVDHPPLAPLLARAFDVLGGGSLLGLRLAPALVAGWLVLAAALVARGLGGGRTSQVVAAACVALFPATRAPEILFGTTALDAAVWAALFVLTVRLLRTGSTRTWLAIGLVTGIGLETKWSVLVLVGGIIAGILLTPRRRLLWSPWFVAGAVLALAVWAPNLAWNAARSWPALEFQRHVAENNNDLDDRLLFFPMQLLLTGVTGVAVWGPGLWWLLRRPAGKTFRPLGIAAVAMTVAVYVAGGKPYYLTPMYIVLAAAGGVALDAATKRRRSVTMWAVAAGSLLAVPLTLPVLPTTSLDAVAEVNPELREMLGWPALVEQVSGAYDSLPAGQRSRTVILTSNYGEAGALLRYRPDLPVYSAHNSFWYEGPPPESATEVLTVGYGPATAERWCGSVETLGTITNPDGVHNQEAGRPILHCRDLRIRWADLWPGLASFH